MELATITADRKTAAAAVRAYRTAIRQTGPDPEDVAILRGYRQLARGRRLISLSEVFAASGYGEFIWNSTRWNGIIQQIEPIVAAGDVPKLAICDATAELCFYDGAHFMANREMAIRSGALVGRDWVRSPLPRRPRTTPAVRAIVPIVPAALRPAGGVGGYHVLWEAQWTLARPIPPRDPALVKWIGGDLWAVLAVWDLSELERAVIAGRAR